MSSKKKPAEMKPTAKKPTEKKPTEKKFHGINAQAKRELEKEECLANRFIEQMRGGGFQCITSIAGFDDMSEISLNHNMRVNVLLHDGYEVISSGMTTVQKDGDTLETGFGIFTHLVKPFTK